MLINLLEECQINMDSFIRNSVPWYNEHSKVAYHNSKNRNPESKYDDNEHLRELKTRYLGVWNAIAVQVSNFINNFDGELETFHTMEAILQMQQGKFILHPQRYFAMS